MNKKRFKLAYEKEDKVVFEDLASIYPRRMTMKEVENLLNELNDKIKTYKTKIRLYETSIDKRIVELEDENEKLRRLLKEKEQLITINLTEEDEKELRKLLGLVNDE